MGNVLYTESTGCRIREAIAEAARKAAAEVAPMHLAGVPFCEIAHIVGAMREAAERKPE